MKFIHLSPTPLAGLLVLLAPVLAAAAVPDMELLRLTPSDVHFVVMVKGLRAHSAQLEDGPFAQTFRTSALGRALAISPEMTRLERVGKELSQALGVAWPRLRDDVLGDAVVFAFSGGPPGHADQERGLLLTWVRDPLLAAKVFERLDQVQKESGELKEVRVLSHRGLSYRHRMKARGSDEFYLVKGSVLAFSSQETAIRGVIDADAQAASDAVPPIARELDRLQSRDSFVSLWINPRRFDSELNQKLLEATGPEAAFLSAFAGYWKALDGVAVACRIERHLEIDVAVGVNRDRFPAALLKAARALNEPSSLSAVFPPDALLSASGRLDLPSLLGVLGEFMTPDAKKTLIGSAEQPLAAIMGKKHLAKLPAHIGPDCGICITAPASANAPLPEMVLAVRIQPGEDRAMEKSILDACDAVVTLLRLQYNARADEPLRLETRRENGFEIKYLTHDQIFPPGMRPAYALRNGFLVVATSPEAILKLNFAAASNARPGPVRLLTISLRGWLSYLKSRPDLGKYIPGDRDEANSQLTKLSAVLELLDRFELDNESTLPGQMKLSAKMHFVQPLKK